MEVIGGLYRVRAAIAWGGDHLGGDVLLDHGTHLVCLARGGNGSCVFTDGNGTYHVRLKDLEPVPDADSYIDTTVEG